MKPTIFLIDDDPIILRSLSLILKNNYQLRLANSGVNAINALNKEPFPDLILLDIEMPNMDGYQVLEQIKSKDVLSAIPVILVTARDTKEDKHRGLALGAVEYIYKPIEPSTLIFSIDTHLNLISKILDIDFLKKMIGTDVNKQKALLEKYLQQAELIISDIRKAADIDNYSEAGFNAHKLKSSSGIVGAIKVQKISIEIDADVKARQYEKINILVQELEAAFKEVTIYIDSHFGSLKKSVGKI
ncbi:MAG: response regulator [Gammaproteobacteria bacterium]|nr:response regulator [Gammaproteobacteria bacterium]